MSLYYSAVGELREIDAALYAAWVEAGNPKADAWSLAPAKPAEDAVWNGSGWTVPTPPVPQSVTARQIRLWLVGHGVSLAAVDAAIDAIPDATQREMARVEWGWAPYIERAHPMLMPLAAALGMSEGQVDAAFIQAASL